MAPFIHLPDPRRQPFGRSPRTALILALAVLLLLPLGAAAQPPDERLDELEETVEALRAQLEAIKEGEQGSADERIAELERKLEVLAAELERMELGGEVIEPTEGVHGLGLSASKIYYQEERGISIGGYGEMLYESFDSSRDDGTPSGETDELDFLRGILYFGYKWNDRWLFNSEIEFEHASTGEEGSASVEFAYIDYLWRPEINVRTGLLLVPMGFVNELHEPPLFLGARRPDVESRIIPTTWRENGFGLFGDIGPVSYRTYIVNGLEGAGFGSSGLRGGRQKGSKALAEDFAWVGRLDYSTPGFLLGASAYVGDSGQGVTDQAGRVIDASTTLLEGHLEWTWRGLELRALGVRGEVDDVARLNRSLGLVGNQSIGEELEGWYVQLGYDVLATRQTDQHSLIPYVRWESLDTQKEVPTGFARNPARDTDILTLGLAYRPIDQVVVKADYQDYDNEAGTGTDQLNVAIGYIF